MNLNIQKILFGFIFSLGIILFLVSNNYVQKSFFRYVIASKTSSSNIQIITSNSTYSILNQEFQSELFFIKDNAHSSDTIVHVPNFKGKFKVLDLLRFNNINFEKIYINNPIINANGSDHNRLLIVNNLLNEISNLNNNINVEYIEIDNVNMFNDRLQFKLNNFSIYNNYINISSITALKDSSFCNASVETVNNQVLINLNKLHINKMEFNSYFNSDLDLSTSLILSRDSIILKNSHLSIGQNFLKFSITETNNEILSKIEDSRLNVHDFFDLDSTRFNWLDNILINGNIKSIKDKASIAQFAINSDLGNIECTVIMDSLLNKNITSKVEFKNFSIGNSLNIDDSLIINASSNIEFIQESSKSIMISSHVKDIKFNDLNFTNLYFSLFNNYTNSTYLIDILSKEKNCLFDLTGELEIDSINNYISSGEFTGKVDYFDLSKFNVSVSDSLKFLSSNLAFDFNHKKPLNNYDFKLKLFDVNSIYLNKNSVIDFINVNHYFQNINDSLISNLNINSSIGSVLLHANTHTNLLNLNFFKTNLLDHFYNFYLDINIVNAKFLSDIFSSKISFEDEFRLKSYYNKKSTPFYLDILPSKLSLYGYVFHNTSLNINNLNNSFNLSSFDVSNSKDPVFDSINFNINMLNSNSGNYKLKFNSINQNNNALITGNVLSNNNEYLFHFNKQSVVKITDNLWRIDSASNFSISDRGLNLKNLAFYLEDESILMNGLVSDKTNINFNFNNFNLKNIDTFIDSKKISYDGVLNGKISYNPFNFPILSGDFKVEDFHLNNVLLGSLQLTNYSNLTNDSLYAIGGINNGSSEIVSFNAQYPLNGTKLINADLLFDNVPVAVLDSLIKPVSNLKGMFNGNLNINGLIDSFKVNGITNASNFQFKIPYLNMKYANDLKIHFNEDSVIVDRVKLIDLEKGTNGFFSASLKHTALKKISYSLFVDSDSLCVLNTYSSDNDDYYGLFFLGGNLSIKGDSQKSLFNINGISKKGTSLMIPLSKSKEVRENSFLRFNNNKNANTKFTNKKNLNPDLVLNFNLDINNDSKFQLIFDEQVGDIIKGVGNGLLTLKIDDSGDFKMFGDFEINEGDYLFTLQDVITKSFSIQDGGSVVFNGDPYDATVDLNLLYNVQASLNSLNPDYSRDIKSPVICRMEMKDKLLLPNINFFIDVPNSDPIIDNSLQSITNTDQKLLEQFLYLLIANNFLIQDDSNIDYFGNTLATTGTELLSNQLSNWLSQTTDAFDLGFKWIPGTGDSLSYQQVELAVSKKLLDDRITINGNLGTPPEQSQANIIGDLDVEYDFFKDGRLKLRVFNRSRDYDPLSESLGYEQGISISFKKQFNSFKKLFTLRRRNY